MPSWSKNTKTIHDRSGSESGNGIVVGAQVIEPIAMQKMQTRARHTNLTSGTATGSRSSITYGTPKGLDEVSIGRTFVTTFKLSA